MSILENIADYMQQLGKQARQASRTLANTDTQQKNQALLYIADALEANAATLKAENAKDLAAYSFLESRAAISYVSGSELQRSAWQRLR